MNLNILMEDDDIIVCEKPAGTPTQTNSLSAKDMVSILKNHLNESNTSNKEPYLGLIHRLDQPVGGVMVFAKNPKAAKFLSEQVQNKTMKKQYLAIITNDLSKEIGKEPKTLMDYLVQNKQTNASSISSASNKNAKKAELDYTVLDVIQNNGQPLSLINVNLKTGRHHQIRVQTAAHLGGIYGDKKYNKKFKDTQTPTNLLLYSHKLSFIHPTSKKEMNFQNIPHLDLFDCFTIV